MLAWCAVLFILGILAFADSILNSGEIFRWLTPIIFMLISLGILIRTTMKIKSKKLENYEERIFNLEREIQSLQRGREKLADY